MHRRHTAWGPAVAYLVTASTLGEEKDSMKGRDSIQEKGSMTVRGSMKEGKSMKVRGSTLQHRHGAFCTWQRASRSGCK